MSAKRVKRAEKTPRKTTMAAMVRVDVETTKELVYKLRQIEEHAKVAADQLDGGYRLDVDGISALRYVVEDAEEIKPTYEELDRRWPT